jgi:hypothetical protein
MSEIEARIRGLVGAERAAVIGIGAPAQAATPTATAPDLAGAAADLRAWREYSTASPFRRSAIYRHYGDAIERGRVLDTGLPEKKD